MNGKGIKMMNMKPADEWSGFAYLLANLIEKYVEVMHLDNLPDPPVSLDSALKELEYKSKHLSGTIEKTNVL
jgi:hypothetical protein